MKDPVALDIIAKLVTYYSDNMWEIVVGSAEYDSCTMFTCQHCCATKRCDETSIHNEGCIGVKLIIESLNYISKC